MKTLRLAEPARVHLDRIAEYSIEKWGKRQAFAYRDAIKKAFQGLLDNPKSGRDRADLRQGYRSLAVGSHVIYYRIEGDVILVMAILHARMDPVRHL